MLLKLTPPVVYLSRAATPSTTVRTFCSRGGDAGPEHANCCSKAAFLPSLTVVVIVDWVQRAQSEAGKLELVGGGNTHATKSLRTFAELNR